MQKMNWSSLLCEGKILPSSKRVNDNNDRSEFERDHNKIIFAPCFRSLQNKTQLFPAPHNDFIHNRLTHSLEVAEVGKSLGNLAAKHIIARNTEKDLKPGFAKNVADIISAACLLHDVGNPPFGHSGEDAISSYFLDNMAHLSKKLPYGLINQLAHFDGNAQTLRIICNSNSLNLTLATVATVIKYPTVYDKTSFYGSKHSVFNSELPLLYQAFDGCGIIKSLSHPNVFVRHPLVFLMEAADDICYRLLDLEDAHKIGVVDYSEAERLLLQIINVRRSDLGFVQNSLAFLSIEDKFARLRSYVINILINQAVSKFIEYYDDIMSGDYTRLIINGKLYGLVDLIINEPTELSDALREIYKCVQQNAYGYRPVIEIELAGYEILGYLLDQFISAAIGTNSKRFDKLMQLLPEGVMRNGFDPSLRVMIIIDYLSGMTDKSAYSLYRKLKGIDFPNVG
ncbi:MAG: deoxyguanosinetriphosphate triphosphohydrolase [Burkholderiales bacterium]|jgi:dGTPase|nr:deoxyguanosinetriphosphate triphosphohydrolase [Burkholderiales bacterium]